MIKELAKKILRRKFNDPAPTQHETDPLELYLTNGRTPWTPGYYIHKDRSISEVLSNPDLVKSVAAGNLPVGYGIGIDERIIEWPWILGNLRAHFGRLCDAGSTLNHDFLLESATLKNKEVSIFTYHPESPSFFQKRISYAYGDLRDICFRDEWFDEVVCISTLEHIDMDNSMYGYSLERSADSPSPSWEFKKVISELSRITANDGQLMITVPFGKFEKHGFFQQFDSEMIRELEVLLQDDFTIVERRFFKYQRSGWVPAEEFECQDCESYNPHTGIGKGNDGAAHSRALYCLKAAKNRRRIQK